MKNLLIFFFFILSIFTYSQTNDYKNQEFKVKKVKTGLWDEFKFHIGLSLKFDVEFKFPISDYNNDTYNISAVLKDSLGNIIFNNKEINAVLYAKSSNKEGAKYIDRGLYLFIPNTEFNLPKGKNKLKLILNAWNENYEFNSIYKGNIDVIVPEYYYYDEQEFNINNYTISQKSINGQQGISVDFNVSYKFMSQQIKDFETNENAKYYYFYILIKDANGRIIYIPDDNPDDLFSDEYKKLLAKDSNEEDKVSIFISYRKLNLKPGSQNIQVSLNVSNITKSVTFQNLKTQQVQIVQPKIYFTELSISDLKIKYGKYDMSSALGRLFSKPEKNKGKGYPDIIWKINTGYDKIYYSKINKNSFYGFDAKIIFKLAENDPLQIVIEANDNLINNDLIDIYNIDNKEGPFKLTLNNLSDGEIENINISLEKSNIPELINNQITIIETNRQGVTGLDFAISYKSFNVNEKYPLTLIPFFIDKNNKKSYIENLRFVNGNTLTNIQNVIINSAENEGQINLFIPAYSVKEISHIGYDVNIKNMLLDDFYYSDEIKIKEINDLRFSIKEIKDFKLNGIYGILINLEYDIPAMYLYDIGYDQIQFNHDFIVKNNMISLNKKIRKTEKTNLLEKTNGFFIPYYLISDFHEKLKVEINFKATINDLIIGKNEKEFSIPETGLANILINNFSFKYNSKSGYYNQLKIQVLHDNRIIGTTDLFPAEKKMYFGMSIPMIASVHPNDDIVIKLIGVSKYESQDTIDQWTILAEKFAEKKIKLPKTEKVKKLIINL